MLSLGGVRYLIGGFKCEGMVICDVMFKLCNGVVVDMDVDGGVELIV